MANTYTVTDPSTGKKVRITGDAPPSEKELDEIFAQVHGAAAPAAPAQPQAPAQPSSSWLGDMATGAAKGAANTVIGLGELVHKIPGVSTAVDALYGTPGLSQASFPSAREDVKPSNITQAIGQGVEQIGEFFLPTGAAGKVGKAAEVAKSALLTGAQGGGPVATGISAGLTAVLPGGGAARRAASAVESSAERSMVRAMAPTKEWAKDEAGKLAPEMLNRGVAGSRPAMIAQASEQGAALGKAIQTEISAATQRGETVAAGAFQSAISKAKDSLMVPDANGVMSVIPGTEAVLARLDKLDEFVNSLGPDIPIDKAAKIKTVWDQIVSKAGLYGQKVGASSTDSAAAWATREGASAFRKLIATGNTTIDNLNKEYAFWKGVKRVLTETEKRVQAQGSGLTSVITGGAGATIGGMTGTTNSDRVQNALLGGIAGQQVMKGLQSAAFRTRVSAPLKMLLADALASGSAEKVENVAKIIMRGMPAQFREAQP